MHPPTSTYSRPFRTSSYSSAADNCVEVADWTGVTAIRDTKHRDLGMLIFPSAEWQALLSTTQNSMR